MKLAYVLSRYPVLTETFIKVELQAHIAAGIDIRVYPLRGPQDTAWVIDNLDDGGVSQKVLRFGRGYAMGNVWAMLRVACARPVDFGAAVRGYLGSCPRGMRSRIKGISIIPMLCGIAGDADAWGAEHVHAHFANIPAAAARFVAALVGVGFSYTSHAFDLYQRDRDSLETLTSASEFVLTISRRNHEYYQDQLSDICAAKVTVVHCGVDTEEFVPSGAGGGPFIAIGRLVPKKGFLILAEAIGMLSDKGIRAECVIVGEGPQRAELEAFIESRHLEGRLRLIGPRPPAQVRSLLGAASAFVLPCVHAADGDRDGIPVSLMEAMAMETLVITTPISGMPELRYGEYIGHSCRRGGCGRVGDCHGVGAYRQDKF